MRMDVGRKAESKSKSLFTFMLGQWISIVRETFVPSTALLRLFRPFFVNFNFFKIFFMRRSLFFRTRNKKISSILKKVSRLGMIQFWNKMTLNKYEIITSTVGGQCLYNNQFFNFWVLQKIIFLILIGHFKCSILQIKICFKIDKLHFRIAFKLITLKFYSLNTVSFFWLFNDNYQKLGTVVIISDEKIIKK